MMIHLRKGAVVAVELQDVGGSFDCIEGRVWITLTGDPRDHILTSGERLRWRKSCKLVMESLRDSCVVVGGMEDELAGVDKTGPFSQWAAFIRKWLLTNFLPGRVGSAHRGLSLHYIKPFGS